MTLMPTRPLQAGTPMMFDDSWYRSVTAFAEHTPWLHEAMSLYTVAGLVVLAAMAVYAWWLARGRTDPRAVAAVAWLGLGTIIAVGGGLVLKQLFAELRPCRVIHVVTVQACPSRSDYSFPSDHGTVAVALALGIWLVDRKLGALAIVLAAIEGFDRVYTGQHYPHDVLGAIALSGAVMLLGWQLARRPLTRLVATLSQTRLRPVLTSAAELSHGRET